MIALSGRLHELILATGDVRVPLGWVLSSHSQQAIECSFGIPDRCGKKSDLQPAESSLSDKEKFASWARRQNGLLITEIGKDLRRE